MQMPGARAGHLSNIVTPGTEAPGMTNLKFTAPRSFLSASR
jgi:hypothetical protein